MYNSVLVTKLINSVMLDGKKGVAQKVVYDAFDIIKEKTGKEPLDAFTEAMNNIMPSLEVKARRVGGATYRHHGFLFVMNLEHDCFSLSLRLEEDGFEDFYHEVHRREVVVELEKWVVANEQAQRHQENPAG